MSTDTVNGAFDNGKHLLSVSSAYTNRMSEITIAFLKFNKKRGWVRHSDFTANTRAEKQGDLVLVKKGNGTTFGVAADVYLAAIEHARSICKDLPSMGNLSRFEDWHEPKDESIKAD